MQPKPSQTASASSDSAARLSLIGGGHILAGHTRLKAAKLLGLETVPVVVADDLSPEQAKAYRLADNKTGELADWDFDLLGIELADIVGIDMSEFGFDVDVPDMCGNDDTESADNIPDAPAEPKTKHGEIYRLGDHVLICGDSTETETFEELFNASMADAHAALCVTSPPYGVGKDYEEAGIEPWFQTMRPVIGNVCSIAEVIVWNLWDLISTGGQFIEPTGAYSVNMFAELGFRPLWVRIWEKTGFDWSSFYHLTTNKPVGQWEYIYAFANPDTYSGHKQRLSQEDAAEWGYHGIWNIRQVTANKEHPAMFPVELPRRCILMHSDPDDIVLEPFSGSGTTIMACEMTGRKCRAVERDPKYMDVAIARWERETGRKAERIG